MTRALITNDDGISSPGLYALAHAALDAGLEVVIAAPAEEASGSSAAITGTNTVAVTGHTEASTISIERRELAEVEGVAAYSVRAAPGLITLLAAHGAFGDAPDVVLSGINRGANLGRVILHSGTEASTRMSLDTFEHTWARSGYWSMIVARPARLAAPLRGAT